MATPMCMSQDGNQAVFVGTMLETGDGFTLCDTCLVAWAAAMLQSMTGVDPTPFLAAISDDVPVMEDGDFQPAGEPPDESGAQADPPPPSEPATGTGIPQAAPKKPTGRRAQNRSGPTPNGSAAAGTGRDPLPDGAVIYPDDPAGAE
jgi:hypothetical protein